jgi:hypothetical protein
MNAKKRMLVAETGGGGSDRKLGGMQILEIGRQTDIHARGTTEVREGGKQMFVRETEG